MTCLTFLSELVQVDVLVATDTTGFQGFIDNPFIVSPGIVTLVTGNGAMFPGKGILAAVMVI
jgi:hypothetical protein